MNDIINPLIPFEAPLPPGGFRPNSEIIVHGRSEKGKHGVFVVEFGAGNDVPLHLSFRYKAENKLVINSSNYGQWQKEERHHNPVFQEHSFILQIQCKQTEFIIWQKHHKFEFKHRMDPSLINTIRINGEVSVEKIEFKNFVHGSATPYANAPHQNPSYPTHGQYPTGPSDFGDSRYQPNIGSGTNPTPYGMPPPHIGGGAQFSQMPQQNPGIGFGAGFGAAPLPNIGHGAGPGGDYGAYPSLNNDNTPTPNAPGGYPTMSPNRHF